MRFYAISNTYLSSIQHGIQAFHVLGEMSISHFNNPSYIDWLSNHKTLICLNGGNNASMLALYDLLSSPDNSDLPVAKFHEDEASMNGMLTSIGIVVPESIYAADLDDLVGCLTTKGMSVWEVRVAKALRKLSTAR